MLGAELQAGVLDFGIDSLHWAGNHALDHGRVQNAARLACGSIVLRSYFSETAQEKRGCPIATDETDLVILLNFFAHSMLKIRAFLHNPKGDGVFQNLYIENVLPSVAIYRALVRKAFGAVECKISFAAMISAEPMPALESDTDLYYTWREYYDHPCYQHVISLCAGIGRKRKLYTDSELSRCLLAVGKMLVRTTNQTLDDHGTAPIFAQDILFRLLVAHDAHFGRLLSYRNKELILGAEHT